MYGTPVPVDVPSAAVTRFVVDCDALLRIAAGEIEVAAEVASQRAGKHDAEYVA